MSKITRSNAARKLLALISSVGRIWVGVDVHKDDYRVAVYGDGRILLQWTMPSDHGAFIRIFEVVRTHVARVVYESGPTGFGFARALEAAGFCAEVVATSKMYEQRGDESKSDSMDARTLAEHNARGMLGFVAVPTAEEERERQVVRLLDQTEKKKRRVMTQIRSFLLMHGIQLVEDTGGWTIAFVTALRRVDLPDELRFTLDTYLDELAYLCKQVKRIKKKLSEIDTRHEANLEVLCSHPGVGLTTARRFFYEIFDAKRFRSAKCVTRLVGLAPGNHGSGGREKKRGVLAAGLARLRSNLIQCAWVWVRRDEQAKAIYTRLLRNTGMAQKAIVGVARRLAAHLWSMLVHGNFYQAELVA